MITVPAYFNDAQRQATKDAGQIAGLEVARIINEPTAASLAYGLDKKKNEKIVVFDLGGGTFDVSVLEVADGVFRVISTNGDTHLGGDDFDQCLINYVADEFKKQYGIDLRKDTMALQRLQEACEKAKKELSSAQSTDINLPFITADASGPEAPADDHHPGEARTTDRPPDRALPRAGAAGDEGRPPQPKDIDEVVLVGGSTRVPKVQQVVKDMFDGKEPHKGVNPGRSRGRRRRHPRRRAGRRRQGRAAAGRDAAVAGHRNPGRHHDQAGREEHDHPHRAEADLQHGRRQPDGRHGEGLSGRAADGRRQPPAGQFNLEGIPPAPRGMPQIEVKFDIDANGILNVSAKDLGTGKEQTVRIEQSSGISEDEIEQDAQATPTRTPTRTSGSGRWPSSATRPTRCAGSSKSCLKEHDAKLNAADKEAVQQGDREDPRGGQERRPRPHQVGRPRVGAGLARPEQDALREGRRTGGRRRRRRRRPAAAGQPTGAAAGGDDDAIDAEFEVKE